MDCQVCFLPYNTSTRKPKSLPCGHTFCAECLTKLLDEPTSRIACPKDRIECDVPNTNIEELATCFALLDLLPDDCADCQKPQYGPCLPEHCSQRLCADCKTSHLKKFSVELVAELRAMRKQVSEQQTMCDDDGDHTGMVDQSKAAIAEVTRVFDAEKEKLIDAIKKKQGISSSDYFQWTKNFNHSLAQARSFVNKILSEIQQEGDSQSGKFLSDVKKQINQEKEIISGVEQTKNQLPLFDASEVQQVFDRMTPALYDSVMPSVPLMPLIPSIPHIPDYTAAEFSQSYGKQGFGAGEFLTPWGVASSPVTGNLAVTDQNDHRIHILTDDLQPIRVFGSKGSGQIQFNCPRGVCFSSIGNLFIADSYNHCIKQFSEEGEHISTFGCEGSGEGQFKQPSGICWDSGLLYTCDMSNFRLQVMKDSGEHVRSIGSKGSGPGQFTDSPWFITASAQHDILVVSDCSRNIHFFSLNGKHRRTIKAGQPPYNIRVAGFVIDKLGQVIVSDQEEGCLVVLGKNDMITTIMMPAGKKMGELLGVTMTSDGNIVVCDFSKSQIHKFTVPPHKQAKT